MNALDKVSEKRGRIGAAWNNPDGSIGIKIDAFVVLSGRDDLEIRLFPYDGKWEERRTVKPRRGVTAKDFDEEPLVADPPY